MGYPSGRLGRPNGYHTCAEEHTVPAVGGRGSEPCRGQQVVPVERVQLLPLFGEPDLGQHTARGGVPLPNRGPQTFVSRRSRPVQNRQRGLGGVSVTPNSAKQLERQFRFPIGSSFAIDQPAVADDVTIGLPLDRQQPDRRWLVTTDPIFKVCNRGVSVSVDPAVRRHSWITFGPKLIQGYSF